MRRLLRYPFWCLGPVGLLVGAVLMTFPLRAAETPQYNRDIRPLLAENCFACHGSDSASRKGDLRLDQREQAVVHQAIVPEKPA